MKSTCVKICKLIDSMCIGCYRTSDEITNWTKYTEEQRESVIREIQSRKGQIIAIITNGDTDVKSIADHYIEIPETIESLTPLLATIPLQLLSYHIAVKLGKNVDQPRNLAKSVTVE